MGHRPRMVADPGPDRQPRQPKRNLMGDGGVLATNSEAGFSGPSPRASRRIVVHEMHPPLGSRRRTGVIEVRRDERRTFAGSQAMNQQGGHSPTDPASDPPKDEVDIAGLEDRARRARVEVIRAVARAQAGHLGGPLSAIDVLTALYGRVMRVRPDEPAWESRDRFVLSKGHAAIGLYAVLAVAGYFPIAELETFDQLGSRLQGHPDMTRLPGIDMSTGSLGTGMSAAVGMAIGAQRRRLDLRVFAMVGDGECQEGQVWEAAIAAARYRLDNLVAIVDVNGLQQFGYVDDHGGREAPWDPDALGRTWKSFGWSVRKVDGHAMADVVAELTAARDRPTPGRPTVVLARTTKGRGVSFMEGRFDWHARVPSVDEARQALAELDR